MRALTLHRPWPWAIFHAPDDVAKRIENRPWKPWRSVADQLIALHAGKTFDSDGAEAICSIAGLHPDGTPPAHWEEEGIIGTVWIRGFTTNPHALGARDKPWWSGPFAWFIAEPLALKEPIPCRGKQGLWFVPPEIEAKIRLDRMARNFEIRR